MLIGYDESHDVCNENEAQIDNAEIYGQTFGKNCRINSAKQNLKGIKNTKPRDLESFGFDNEALNNKYQVNKQKKGKLKTYMENKHNSIMHEERGSPRDHEV